MKGLPLAPTSGYAAWPGLEIGFLLSHGRNPHMCGKSHRQIIEAAAHVAPGQLRIAKNTSRKQPTDRRRTFTAFLSAIRSVSCRLPARTPGLADAAARSRPRQRQLSTIEEPPAHHQRPGEGAGDEQTVRLRYDG